MGNGCQFWNFGNASLCLFWHVLFVSFLTQTSCVKFDTGSAASANGNPTLPLSLLMVNCPLCDNIPPHPHTYIQLKLWRPYTLFRAILYVNSCFCVLALYCRLQRTNQPSCNNIGPTELLDETQLTRMYGGLPRSILQSEGWISTRIQGGFHQNSSRIPDMHHYK